MPKKRILFVDDEPGIRLTLPLILQRHGFEVRAASSVPEALELISKEKFDVLLSDLNVGEQGDGFTVVSAMRRVQPSAVTLILTGFPAFESALRAIKQQVDDYLMKPTQVEDLVRTIEQRLSAKTKPRRLAMSSRVPDILHENAGAIAERWLECIAQEPKLTRVRLSREERLDFLPKLIGMLVALMRSGETKLSDEALAIAAEHGRMRRDQGYTVPMMLEEGRLLDDIILQVVREKMLDVDLSFLMQDIIVLNDALNRVLAVSADAFLTQEPKIA